MNSASSVIRNPENRLRKKEKEEEEGTRILFKGNGKQIWGGYFLSLLFAPRRKRVELCLQEDV